VIAVANLGVILISIQF